LGSSTRCQRGERAELRVRVSIKVERSYARGFQADEDPSFQRAEGILDREEALSLAEIRRDADGLGVDFDE
jgi:hypothetical protein